MQNNFNTDQTTESNTTRRNGHRRRQTTTNNRDVIVNQERYEPMITIQATILTFMILFLVLTPILIGIYTTIYVFASEIGFVYNMFIYPIMPIFPSCLVSDRVIAYFNTFLITILIGFVVAIWRTTYYAIRVFIVIMGDSDA